MRFAMDIYGKGIRGDQAGDHSMHPLTFEGINLPTEALAYRANANRPGGMPCAHSSPKRLNDDPADLACINEPENSLARSTTQI